MGHNCSFGGQLLRKLFLLGLLPLVSCSPIQQQTQLSTPLSQSLVAGVGDVVFRAEGRENMPNAFGASDIFGRTRSTGFTTIQYGGIQGNKVVLLRSGVVTQSDATTTNSTAVILPTQQRSVMSGSVGNTPVSATSTTNGMVYIPAAGSTSTNMQQPTIPILVDWKSNPRVIVLGHSIVVEAAELRVCHITWSETVSGA